MRHHREARLALAVGLCLATLVVYAPVLGHGFVLWDDPEYVTANAMVLRGVTLDGLRWVFTEAHAANWHPLTWLSHMLDVEVFGTRAGRHHAVSLLLHVANALVLWWVLGAATRRPYRAGVVAGLFALHPLNVESVAWVAERKNLLCTLFWLLALLAWGRYAKAPSWRTYAAALTLAACALMAKPMAVTLPLTLLLVDAWPLARLRGHGLRRVVETLPFFGLAGATAALTLWAQHAGGATETSQLVALPLRLANACVTPVVYLLDAVWPTGLAVFYPHPDLGAGTPWAAWQVVGSGAFLAVVTVAALRSRRGDLVAGWLWYLVTLIPVLGLVQVGEQARADRYTYVPLIGVWVAVVWGAGDLAERVGRGWARAVPIASVVVLLGVCAILSRAQLAHWRDSERLFSRAIAVGSETSAMHNSLGSALAAQGRWPEALAHHERAVVLLASDWRAQYNLANALRQVGQGERAVDHYREALRFRPDDPAIHNNLGGTLHALGRLDEAEAHYREALRLDPDAVTTMNNLGAVLNRSRRPAEAQQVLRRAARLAPGNAAVHENLGDALRLQGNLDGALRHYRRALRASPDDASLREALEATRAAIAERPSAFQP